MTTNLMFQPLRKYADFQGRARRMEYWLFYLFYILILFVFMIGAGFISAFSGAPSDIESTGRNILVSVWMLGFLLLCLALVTPSIAAGVRRLHDTNRSGWWMFISFIPFGGIVLLVFFCMDGTRGPNRYGSDPKIETTAETFS